MTRGAKIVGLIIILLILWAGFSFLGRDRQKLDENAEPITIGFIGPLTGDAATLGQNAKAAVEIAVEEVNRAGGVNGRPLAVIYEDGKCSGREAANAANKLINVDKVPLILGGACSGETLAFASLAEETKTVTLSYCSSAPSITAAGDYIFRNYPSDSFQGRFAADYLFNTLNKKNVAILYVKADWGVGIHDVFVSRFKELGGTILADEGYEQTARDLRSALTKIKSVKPDALYFLGYTEATIPGLKQAKELGLNIPIFGGDAWGDPKIAAEAGAAAEDIMYVVPATREGDDFKAKLKAKTGSDEVAVCTPTAYDAVFVIAEVMKKSGADPEAIKNEIYKASYRNGISFEEISFDSNGDLAQAGYIVKTIKNGKEEAVR